MRMKRIAALASLSATLAAMVFSNEAQASGFMIRENSAEAVGMAYAGEGSLADDPSTVFNNPAGMAWLQGDWLDFGAGAIFPTVDFHGASPALTSPFFGPEPGNDSGNGGRSALIPNGYGLYHINDRLTAGLAVTAPFGNMIKYNSMFYGRYTDVEFSALTVDVNPNLAYKVNDQLSIGGGLSAQYFTGTFIQAINGAALGLPSDADLRAKGDNWGFGYNLGLLAKPWADWGIGVTYRSKIEHKVQGDANFQKLPPPLLGALGFANGPASIDIAVPATIGTSVTHDVTEKLTIASELQWTEWHSFASTNLILSNGAELPVVQHYQNSWMVSAGAQYHLTPAWTLRGGLGWDQSPVTDQYRSVSLPDQDRYMVAVGFGYAFSERLGLDAAYTHYFATHGSINDSSTVTSPTGDTVHGNYQLSIDYLVASLKYKF